MHWEGSALGMRLIGYPDYLMSILGFWKELGCLAILVPGFGRLKGAPMGPAVPARDRAMVSDRSRHQAHDQRPVISEPIRRNNNHHKCWRGWRRP